MCRKAFLTIFNIYLDQVVIGHVRLEGDHRERRGRFTFYQIDG